jgi:hypothetical protein
MSLSEDEVVAIINNVANRLAKRFQFGYHEIEDMRQQARLFAWEAMSNYDGVRPLENFLWTHVRNRLFNFKRDKYERPGKPCLDCEHSIYDNIDGDGCHKFASLIECSSYSSWINRNQRKRNIMHPIGIDSVNDENERTMHFIDNIDSIDYKELLTIINEELPINLRPLFLRLKFGSKLTKLQKTKIQTAVKEILIKYGYNS